MNKEELIEECLKEQIKARDEQIHELNEEIQKLMAKNSNMERTLEIKQNHILMAEIERLNNKLLRIKKLINRTPRQTPTEVAYVWLKAEIAKVIGDDKK